MNRILNFNGSTAVSGGPELTDAERAQRQQAANARHREEAAFRLQRYVIARVKKPNVVRMPEPVDLQVLLDERKALYEHLGNMQQQATMNFALILHALKVDRVEITGVTFEEVDGWEVRQSEGVNNTMILELVRPDPAGEDEDDAGDDEP